MYFWWRVVVLARLGFSRQLSFLGGLFRGFAPEEIEEDSWKYASSMTPPSLTVTRLSQTSCLARITAAVSLDLDPVCN